MELLLEWSALIPIPIAAYLAHRVLTKIDERFDQHDAAIKEVRRDLRSQFNSLDKKISESQGPKEVTPNPEVLDYSYQINPIIKEVSSLKRRCKIILSKVKILSDTTEECVKEIAGHQSEIEKINERLYQAQRLFNDLYKKKKANEEGA